MTDKCMRRKLLRHEVLFDASLLQGPGADYVDLNLKISSDEIYFSPKVQHMINAANLASCLFNDIYSFPKVRQHSKDYVC